VEPTKEKPFSFVLFESQFTSVSTVSRGDPSSGSLFNYIRTGAGFVPLISADNREETDRGGAFLTCFRCVLDSNMFKGVCSIVPSMLVSLLYFVTLIPYGSGREDCKE
jgi:hypothetical protein